MKLVKEYINEKFEEDSDPIHDLGIGNAEVKIEELIQPILNDYKAEYKGKDDSRVIKQYFKKIKDVLEPLLINRYVQGAMWEVGGGRWKRNGFTIKVTKILSPGTIFRDNKLFGLLYFNVGASNGKKYCIYISTKYFISSKPKGRIYEKFEEQSDPVEDMRIGTKWKEKLALKFLDWVNNDFQMVPGSKDYWEYLNVSMIGMVDKDLREGFIEYVHNWTKYRKVLKELNIKITTIPDVLETIFERPYGYYDTTR